MKTISIEDLIAPAVDWVSQQESRILALGELLTDHQVAIAAKNGVHHPERIRLLVAPGIPKPTEPRLRDAAAALGLFCPGVVGVAFGYGVLIREGHFSEDVLSHEFRHVRQYEDAGSLEVFVRKYLHQIAQLGYLNSPFEIDARTDAEPSVAVTVPNIPGWDQQARGKLRIKLRDGTFDEQEISVHLIDDRTLRILDSSGFFDCYQFLFGDCFRVNRIAENAYEVMEPISPQTMRHFGFMASQPPVAYTQILHQLGGEWDHELMQLRIHVPADQVDELLRQAGGFNLNTAAEIFSAESE